MSDVGAAVAAEADATGVAGAKEISKELEKLDDDSPLKWEDVAKGLSVIGLVAYIGGLVVVNAYLSRFGASDFDVVRPHSIATAILALVVIAVPLGLSFWATRWAHTPAPAPAPPARLQALRARLSSPHPQEPLLAVLGALFSLVGVSMLVATWPTAAAWYAVIPLVLGAIAIIVAFTSNWRFGASSGATVTRRAVANAKKGVRSMPARVYVASLACIYLGLAMARHYARAVLGVDASFGPSLVDAIYLWGAMIVLAFPALILFDDIGGARPLWVILMGRADRGKQAKQEWGLIVIVTVAAFAYCTAFGLYLYPAIPQTWGGGMPEEARLILTRAGVAEAREAHIPLCPASDATPLAFGRAMPVASGPVKILYETTDTYLLDTTPTVTDTHSIVSFDKAGVAGVIHPARNPATGAEDPKPIEQC